MSLRKNGLKTIIEINYKKIQKNLHCILLCSIFAKQNL